MCGICGLISPNSINIPEIISEMNSAIQHRGPDDEGLFIEESCGLAMRRLSIIDLKTGHQPIFTADKRFAIVFNGEIYNYRDLKEKHLGNYNFSTQSDTEVVLNLYQKMGSNCLELLRGIFAFAIYDRQKKELFIARDHLGVKPLYYYTDNKSFLFASDILSFHHLSFIDLSINRSVITDYLRYGYIPHPKTIFKNVHKLPPGNFMLVQADGKYVMNPYYNISEKIKANTEANYHTAKSQLKEILHQSVKEQMISDVPLGAFLSGGIDSSVITAEMAGLSSEQVTTFTIGFKGASNTNDVKLSSLLASRLSTAHHERIVEPDINNVLERIIGSLGEPFAISSMIPIYINSLVAKEKVKVALSGDGADEILGGYGRYNKFFKYHSIMWLRHLPLSGLNDLAKSILKFANNAKLSKAHRLLLQPLFSFLTETDKLGQYNTLTGVTQNSVIDDILLEKKSSGFDQSVYARQFTMLAEKDGFNMNSLMLFDTQTSLLDEMLTKVDFASMLASLEVRVPFLDHRVVEFSLSLPEHYKIRRGNTKEILKDAYQGLVPDEILNASKRGFNLPLDFWIKNYWAEMFLDAFEKGDLNLLGLDKIRIMILFKKYLTGYPMSGKIFFYIYVLVSWHEKFQSRKRANKV